MSNMVKNTNLESSSSAYRNTLNTYGFDAYKSKIIFNTYNRYIGKKQNSLTKIASESSGLIAKYSTISCNMLKKTSMDLDKKRLSIVKINENKNFRKKNM